MRNVKWLIVIGFVFTLFNQTGAEEVAEPKELYWEDLIPEGFAPSQPPPVSHQMGMSQVQPNAPVIPELDGQYVKIPGFVVPLEGDEQRITEFLLVPYFGACIHVPPPPSNQIVHVVYEEGISIDSLYDAIWMTGTLSTQSWTGDIASVGYRLKGSSSSIFEG